MAPRVAAGTALVLWSASIVLAATVAVRDFPRALFVVVFGLLAVAAAWYALRRRGAARDVGFASAVILLGGAVAVLLTSGYVVEDALVLAGLLIGGAAARAAFAVHVRLSPAARPRRPVLFMNPRSGGGKAERFKLADEARARGIEPIELCAGDDLKQLARDAVSRGADALAMAGGDGSQAIVAEVAAESGLPYACIPAGTRNHFALDLGVDRNDVVGALDSLVDGGERRADLAEVNGRVFVNNVSLGVYAEAVQREGYRESKIRTILDTIPDVLGPGREQDLRWTDLDGEAYSTSAVVLVSNNRYRLGRAIYSGTRPRIDAGRLGVAIVLRADDRRTRLREWEAPEFSISSDAPVKAGVDGEALVLDSPLTFRSRPGALRVRIAGGHPGASPSAAEPETAWGGIAALARIAIGRSHEPDDRRNDGPR